LYCIEHDTLEMIDTYIQSQQDDKRNFDYIFLNESDNLILDYHLFHRELNKYHYAKAKMPNHCRLRDFHKFMIDYEEFGEVLYESEKK
ncbi:MAG: hypothetical protein AAF518_22510, partial [Spirochaetota bacterium]